MNKSIAHWKEEVMIFSKFFVALATVYLLVETFKALYHTIDKAHCLMSAIQRKAQRKRMQEESNVTLIALQAFLSSLLATILLAFSASIVGYVAAVALLYL